MERSEIRDFRRVYGAPGLRGACHRARVRATRWLHPGYGLFIRGTKAGLLTWGMCMSRPSSHLFVRLRPPLRPDHGLCRMTRADQVKAGPLGPPRSGLALS